METTAMKPRILTLLAFAHQQEQNFVAMLDETERERLGTLEHWSTKDILVNIMSWKQLQTQKLVTALAGEVPPVWKDMKLVDQLDAQIFARYQHQAFQDIQNEAERIYAELIAQVESMSEEELTDPDRYAWQNGEALWEETLGNGAWHPISQLTRLYQERGDLASAIALQEAQLTAARQAHLPLHMLAGTLYNLACFYALNNLAEQALLALAEALPLRPTLIEWSKHDTDLASLRSLPALQALYADPRVQEVAPVNDLIVPDELRERLATPTPPLVIDVREPSEYNAGHVQSALNIPLGQLSKQLTQLSRDQFIVTYCNMHHRGESRGERAASLLREQGYVAKTLDGGYPGWIS